MTKHLLSTLLWNILLVFHSHGYNTTNDRKDACGPHGVCSCSDEHINYVVSCGGSDLDEIPNRISPKVTFLYLGGNEIRKIRKSAFKKLKKLDSLDFSYNIIVQIPRDFLANLRVLEQLDFDSNEITEIRKDTFKNQKHLQYIRLSFNKIEVIHRRAFSNLDSLQDLFLEENLIHQIQENAFVKLPDFTSLILLHNNLTQFPGRAFHRPCSPRILELSKNKITILHNETFLSANGETKLDLSDNRIELIEQGTFDKIMFLEELYLTDNRIKELPEDIFQKLVYIMLIDLGLNRIDLLQAGLFKNLNDLGTVDLHANHIKDIHVDVFSDLESLEYLYLYENYIEDVHRDLFRNLSQLKFLSLSHNAIQGLPEDVFRNLHLLKELELAGNKFTTVPSRSFRFIKGLDTLDVSSNEIYKLTDNDFAFVTSLRKLNLSSNALTELTRNIFKDLRALESLELAGNRVQTVSSEAFNFLFKLNALDLSNNEIEHIMPNTFYKLPDLQNLQLHGNKLKNVSYKLFQHTKLLNLLSIADNDMEFLPSKLLSQTELKNVLDFSWNQLKELPPMLFRTNMTSQKLWRLFLQRNLLSYLPKNVFEGLTGITVLCLFDNNIKYLADGAFINIKIQTGYLFGNEISQFSNVSFQNKFIEEMHLYGNHGLRVKTSALEGVDTSANLFLSCESLEEVQKTNVTLKCVTPSYVPMIKVDSGPVQVAIERSGFHCKQETPFTKPECAPCPRGTFSNGAGGCIPCPPGGFYEDAIGVVPKDPSVVCKQCPVGTYVKKGNASTIADCKVCPEGTDKRRHAGYRACLCLDGYHRVDRFGPCFVCKEDGINCSGQEFQTIRRGFFWSWNFNGANKTLYQSFILNLKNETRFHLSSSSATNYSLAIPKALKCPRLASCNNSGGSIQASCAQGYRGLMCSKCSENYYSVLNNCIRCPTKAILWLEIAALVFTSVLVVLLVLRKYKRDHKLGKKDRTLMDIVFSRGKIVLGFYQVVGEFFMSLHEINWTGSLYAIGDVIATIELNILRVLFRPQCFHKDLTVNPKIEFMVGLTFVFSTSFISVLFYWFRKIQFQYLHKCTADDPQFVVYLRTLRSRLLTFVVIVLFITYAPVSTIIFQLHPRTCEKVCFDVNKQHCVEILRSDFDIDCTDLAVYHCFAYFAMFGYVIAFPTIILVLLRKYTSKSHGNKGTSTQVERQRNLPNEETEKEATPTWVNFLCENYKSNFWYWEVVELTRKVTQTMLVTLLGWESKMTVLLTIGISTLYLILHARCMPMKSSFEQRLQMLSLVGILANVLVVALGIPKEKEDLFSVALVLLNTMVLIIIAAEAILGLLIRLKHTVIYTASSNVIKKVIAK